MKVVIFSRTLLTLHDIWSIVDSFDIIRKGIFDFHMDIMFG